jgi:hypothetical protein
VLAPHAFRHPDANREALLGKVLVAYEFKRGKRKNIGFVRRPRGPGGERAALGAAGRSRPGGARQVALDRQQARSRARAAGRLEAARIEWKDGATFPFLGEQVILVLDPRHDFREPAAC